MKRVMQVDLQEGIACGYGGTVPAAVTRLKKFNQDLLIAYGGEDAFLVDPRANCLAMNLNPLPELAVGAVLVHSNPNQCYVSADNALVVVDLRTLAICEEVLSHPWAISSFSFMQEGGYCLVGDPFSAAADLYRLY